MEKTNKSLSYLIKVAVNTFLKCKEILERKNFDYANSDNAFENFELVAQISKTNPERVMLNLIGVKVARLTELLTSCKKPKNESIEDTIDDLINYAVILKAYLKTKRR